MTDRKEYMKKLMREKRANKLLLAANTSANKPAEIANKSGEIANKPANKMTQTANTIKQSVSNSAKAVSKSVSWQNVDQSIFDGHGRGVPVNGYVLIGLGKVGEDRPENGVVTVADWQSRMDYTCQHNFNGWTCKACL